MNDLLMCTNPWVKIIWVTFPWLVASIFPESSFTDLYLVTAGTVLPIDKQNNQTIKISIGNQLLEFHRENKHDDITSEKCLFIKCHNLFYFVDNRLIV